MDVRIFIHRSLADSALNGVSSASVTRFLTGGKSERSKKTSKEKAKKRKENAPKNSASIK